MKKMPFLFLQVNLYTSTGFCRWRTLKVKSFFYLFVLNFLLSSIYSNCELDVVYLFYSNFLPKRPDFLEEEVIIGVVYDRGQFRPVSEVSCSDTSG